MKITPVKKGDCVSTPLSKGGSKGYWALLTALEDGIIISLNLAEGSACGGVITDAQLLKAGYIRRSSIQRNIKALASKLTKIQIVNLLNAFDIEWKSRENKRALARRLAKVIT